MDQATQNLILAAISLIVGAALGGGGVLAIVNRIINNAKSDKVVLDALEKAYQSIPLDGLRGLLRNVAEVLGQVTDGLPNEGQPPKPQG